MFFLGAIVFLWGFVCGVKMVGHGIRNGKVSRERMRWLVDSWRGPKAERWEDRP